MARYVIYCFLALGIGLCWHCGDATFVETNTLLAIIIAFQAYTLREIIRMMDKQ